jgi:chaperonin GroEL
VTAARRSWRTSPPSPVIAPEVGLKLTDADIGALGKARRVVVSKDNTTIVDGAGPAEDIEARVAQLRKEIEATDSDWDREKLEERVAKLSGGIAVIRVGAATETELKERKHRIEDAVAATKAAVEEGIVTGGGAALVHASRVLVDGLGLTGDEATGVKIVHDALSAPLFWIAANAGQQGSVIVNRVRESEDWSHGYNATTLTFGDLIKDGVVDPVKVTRSAVINAASIARMVLTTESAIVEKPENAAPAAGGHGHGHGHGH